MTYTHFQKLVDKMFEPLSPYQASDMPPRAVERYNGIDEKELNPLVAAFIGDAYYHLFIRTRLLAFEQKQVRVLNEFSSYIVSAVSQAEVYNKIESSLTDAEKTIYRRGRNAHSHAPRRASVAQYHASTGFEALLGTLYLTKKFDRLQEITELAFQSIVQDALKKNEGVLSDS